MIYRFTIFDLVYGSLNYKKQHDHYKAKNNRNSNIFRNNILGKQTECEYKRRDYNLLCKDWVINAV